MIHSAMSAHDKSTLRSPLIALSSLFSRLECQSQRSQIERLISASPGEVDEAARSALASQLLWCQERVPFYRQLLEGWTSDEIQHHPREALETLPILDKDELRAQGDRLKAQGIAGRRLRLNSSGGSTGAPVQLLQDLRYRRWNRASSMIFESWTGYQPGQRKCVLWGMPRDLAAGRRPLTRLRNKLQNRHLLDAYQMSEQAMEHFVQRLGEHPPVLLRCLAQSGAELARYILETGRKLHGIGAILSTGGVLHQNERQQMASAFGAPVFNLYGSREVGPIACESPNCDVMKTIPLTHKLEVVSERDMPQATGQSGDIVVTLLTNRIMPLLRYRIGDRGRWAASDGQLPAWPALEAVEGRVMGHFVTKQGALVNGEYFTHLIFQHNWIERFQWIQHSTKELELKVVPGENRPSDGELESVRESLERQSRSVLGASTRLQLRMLDRIDASPSGKHHYTISKVSRPRTTLGRDAGES